MDCVCDTEETVLYLCVTMPSDDLTKPVVTVVLIGTKIVSKGGYIPPESKSMLQLKLLWLQSLKANPVKSSTKTPIESIDFISLICDTALNPSSSMSLCL